MEDDTMRKPLNQTIKQSIQPEQPIQRNKKSELSPKRSSVNDPYEQSLLSVEDSSILKSKKKYKIITAVSIVCILIGILFMFLFTSLLLSAIKNMSIEQIIFTEDNQGLWAHFPGDSNVDVTRNFTFFNLTNQYDVILFNAKPIFKEISGFKITQFQDYQNRTYLNGGASVHALDWLHFEERQQSRNLDEKVKILNLGKLAYWYQLKNARQALLLQQGLATIYSSLQTQIVNTIFAQGIKAQFLLNDTNIVQSLLAPAQIEQINQIFLINDDVYGLSQQNNLRIWINATQTSIQNNVFIGFSEDALILKDYFVMTDMQLSSILLKLQSFINALGNIVFTNHYCFDLQNCNGHKLAALQISNLYVTYNTPPTSSISPSITICESNVTCQGKYPEIAAFFQKVYKPTHSQIDPNLQFPPEIVYNIFNYNLSTKGLDYNTNENSLLHIGNLDALWSNGTLFDSGSIKGLQNIKNRFQLPSLDHTRVFWEWSKYFFYDIVRQNGNNQHVGMSSIFAKYFYQQFSRLQDVLQVFLISEIIYQNIFTYNCEQFMKQSFGFINDTKAQNICTGIKINNVEDIKKLILSCKNTNQIQYHFLQKLGANAIDMQNFCENDGTDTTRFGNLYHRARKYLNDFYNCTYTPVEYCSDYQLAAMQWANATVTKFPIQQIKQKYKAKQTIAHWFTEFQPFEYSYYTSFFNKRSLELSLPQRQFHVYTKQQTSKMLNFDNWFSSSIIQRYIMDQQPTQQRVDEQAYIKYCIIFVGMKGFTQQRSARDIVFGYTDELLEEIRLTYPPFGGDPSAPSLIALNDPNVTRQQATLTVEIDTGKFNYTQLGQYKNINGLPYSTINKTYFNGNQTYSVFQSPWIGEDYFYGTAAKMFSPNQFDSPNISLFIPNLLRYGSGQQTLPYQRFGFDLRIAYLGQYIFLSTSQSDINARYYQSYYAFFNETSVYGFPLFATKNHFMNCSQNWTNLIDVYNEDGTIYYNTTSHWDDSFVIIQPFSGASFQSTLFLQLNYHLQPDLLFNYHTKAMLPIASVWRSGNISAQIADKYFGELKTGLAVKQWLFYIGIVVLIASLVILGIAIFKLRAINKCQKKNLKSSLKFQKNKNLEISLQNKNRLSVTSEQQSKMVKVENDEAEE